MKLNNRELGTVLAALRYWQNELEKSNGIYPEEKFTMITTDCDSFKALTIEEIDDLCEKINQ